MPRIVSVSLVLALAIGPSAATWCNTSCNTTSATTGCSHAPQSVQTIATSNSCSGVGIFTAVLREDLRRSESSSNLDGVASPAADTVDPFKLTADAPHIGPPEPSGANRPLSVALRI